MPNPVQSTLSPFEISADGITWKQVVCTKSYTLPLAMQSTTEYTQCGPIIGTGPVSHDPTVQAVCEIYPSALQWTYKDALAAEMGTTTIYYRIQYPGTGSIGYAYYICGKAYVTDTQLINQTNSVVNFSFQLKGQGIPATTSPNLPT